MPPKRRAPPPVVPEATNSSSSVSDEDEEEEEANVPLPPMPPTASSKDLPNRRRSREVAEDVETSGDTSGPDSENLPSAGGAPGGSKKPRPFRRRWSTADDIEVLEALAAYREKHGALPTPGELLASLHGHHDREISSVTEISERTHGLRVRYNAAAKRLSTKGVPLRGAESRQIYELSKLVWGCAVSSPREGREIGELAKLYPNLAEEVKGLEVRHRYGVALRLAFGRIHDNKVRELDVKVKEQHLAEFKMRMQLGDLRKEVTLALLGSVE